MDENERLEAIKDREELIATDSSAPLHLIRQKELELSGRLLQAREQAAEIVAKARRDAVELMSQAEGEADQAARAYESERMGKAQQDVSALRGTVSGEVEKMRAAVATRHDAAVQAVVERVTRI